jgi:hypothetical protein
MYYWTSASPVFKNESVFWCSSNATSNVAHVSEKFHQQNASNQLCVALQRWSRSFVLVNCSRKLSFVCEVFVTFLQRYIFFTNSSFSIPVKRLLVHLQINACETSVGKPSQSRIISNSLFVGIKLLQKGNIRVYKW